MGRNAIKFKDKQGNIYDVKDAEAREELLLQVDNIPGTTQTIAFDSHGDISSITHENGSNETVRTDVFTFGTDTITEVRTLSTGASLTIVTNMTTLVTTVTYANE